MKFTVSEMHLKHQTRKSVWIGVMFTALLAGSVASLFQAEKISSMIIPAVSIYIFMQALWTLFKRMKEGAASFPVVELNEMTGTLAVSHKELTVTMPLDQIRSLRLQYKSGELRSILAQTRSSGLVRFEGYEHLEELASTLKKYVSVDNIKRAAFYHR